MACRISFSAPAKSFALSAAVLLASRSSDWSLIISSCPVTLAELRPHLPICKAAPTACPDLTPGASNGKPARHPSGDRRHGGLHGRGHVHQDTVIGDPGRADPHDAGYRQRHDLRALVAAWWAASFCAGGLATGVFPARPVRGRGGDLFHDRAVTGGYLGCS